MRLISAGSLVRAQSGPFFPQFGPTEYAHPKALLETDWEKTSQGTGIRVIESNEDILLSDTEDIPMRRASIGAPIFRIW